MQLKQVAKRIANLLPPRARGAADYFLRPGIRSGTGGPLNGQRIRMQTVLELEASFDFAAIVETGTFRGTTTEFFARITNNPVYTVEATPRFFYYSRIRLRPLDNVSIHFGSSTDFLKEAGESDLLPAENIFFYLDAHWHDHLPLAEELQIIEKYWRRSVIMIDDFQVPGDSGFFYDDYGKGKRLTLDYVNRIPDIDYAVFFPSASSAHETGARRGSAVLVPEALAERVEAGCATLERYRP